MPGKAYTLKEMKLIVDYLREHKAYDEIRGRKMWMDFANTKVLDRTWQSLKETFLKRILPDIHNPYYNLTVQQIASFRQEIDVEARNKNKLDIVTISEDSSDGKYAADPVQSKKENQKTGEKKSSKTDLRSSTETVVLEENCYETAEDVQRVLESPAQSTGGAPKSLRDFITYSEPLTPLLQDVIHDFDSDDDEPQLQIVEPENIKTEGIEGNKNESPSPDPGLEPETNTVNETTTAENANEKSKIKSLKLKKTQKGTWENKETQEQNFSKQVNGGNEQESEIVFPEGTTPMEAQNPGKNNVSSEKNATMDKIENSNDTAIPNNQEELGNQPNENRKSTESNCSDLSATHKKHKKVKSRKRSYSQNSTDRKRKRSQETPAPREQEVDTQTYNSHPQATSLLKNIYENTNAEDGTVVNNSETTTNGSIQTDVKKTNEGTSQEAGPSGINFTANIETDAQKTNEGTSQEAGPSCVNFTANIETNAQNANEGTSQKAGPSGVNFTANSDVNPCLKSVSLFEEQFSTSKYSYSENEEDAQDKETRKPECKTTDPKENLSQSTTDVNQSKANGTDKSPVINKSEIDKVILLKSHSESDSDDIEVPKKKARPAGRISKSQTLANVFGFSSGTLSLKRPRHRNSSRRYPQRHGKKTRNLSLSVESGSSDEYTTASDSQDISPRAFRNLYRRYGKPQSYDILNHPDGGGQFIVGRKKIYPLVMRENGKLYYALAGEDASDDTREYYWKEKYMEEKKKLAEEKIRADELARLLKQAQEDNARKAAKSPILQTIPSTSKRHNKEDSTIEKGHNDTDKEQKNDLVKIKFTKNKEIELEGQWPSVNPLLEKMVSIMKNNYEMSFGNPQKSEIVNVENKPSAIQEAPKIVQNETKSETHNDEKSHNESTEKNANTSTITNDKGNSKVAIDGKAKTKQTQKKANASKSAENMVEVSSGISTPVGEDPGKMSIARFSGEKVHEKVNQLESEIFKQIEEIHKSDNSLEVPNENNINTRSRGRPKKTSSSLSISSGDGPSTRSMSPKKSTNKVSKSESVSNAMPKRPTRAPRKYESDSGVTTTKLRKFSSNLSLNLSGQKNVIIPVDDPNVKYMFPPSSLPNKTLNKNAKKSSRSYYPQTIVTSPENISRFSESTQGYQDSDASPPSLNRKKKTIGSTGLLRVKRRASPYLADEDTNETNDSKNSKSQVPVKENSSIYRSESYQLLLPKPVNVHQMDRIEERYMHSVKDIEDLVNDNNEFYITTLDIKIKNNLSKKNSEGNSSSVSLPLSPEISVVENLSVSKDTISNSLEEHPTLNELHADVGLEQAAEPENYMIDDIDVSVPLMEQDFALHSCPIGVNSRGKNTISESLVNKVSLVEIQEPSLSDSLNLKLRDMFLESAKKISQQGNNPGQDNQMDIDAVASNKKVKGNKRCSTPRKRNIISRSKTPNIVPVLEEHTESCSIGGRKSCPPVISVIAAEEIPAVDHGFEISNQIDHVEVKRGRRKKDIIKVKILRPRSKSSSVVTANESTLSVYIDSGINDTSTVTCPSRSDSTELIHNHSDTCLHMDQCFSDSVEFIDNGTKSIISLSSTSNDFNKRMSEAKESSGEFVTPEMFCTNAQDATVLADVASRRTPTQTLESNAATQYHTPSSISPLGSFTSLITEDMSEAEDQPPSASKWYLVNEQETNFVDACSQPSNSGGVGSNLKQIFPVACAVPNLSTITETSKENDSNKPTRTTYVQQTDFQSIFNP